MNKTLKMSVKKTKLNKNSAQVNSIDTVNISKDREEILRWLFSLISSLAVFSIVALLIQKNSQPDISGLINEGNKLSFLGMIRPEPVEALLVRIGIVFIPILLIVFYAIFSKTKLVVSISNTLFSVLGITIFLLVIVLIYKGFSALNPFNPETGEQAQHIRDIDGKTNFGFYFKGLFLDKNLLFYIAICVPILFGLFVVGFKKFNWETKFFFKSVFPVVAYSLLGILVICIFGMNTFEFPYTYENKYDFNAIYYSVTQVFSGSPMFIDNFTNTYGLYPHFLNPIFKIIGLSVFNFSLVMSILLALSFLFIILFLKKNTSNVVIVFLGVLTLINFSYLNFRFTTPFDCSFAFFPIRFVIPSTLLFLTSLYLTKKSKVLYWITFFVMGAFILWNPEIGMVCFASWLVINIYSDFYNAENKIEFKKNIYHLLAAILVIAVVFSVYAIIINFIYGKFPDLKSLFSYILIFGKYGFGALPMTLIHPWNIVALIYITGFLFAIVKWYNKQVTTKSTLILLTSIIGIGFFIYFQGRSHNFTFATSACFGIVLLILLADELWLEIKRKNILFLNLIFFVFILIASFSFFDVLTNISKIKELVYQKQDKTNQLVEEKKIKSNEDFIIANSVQNEKIHVLTARELQGLYFNGNKRVSAFNPGILELAYNSDLSNLERVLRDSSFKIFIEPDKFNLFFMQKSFATMASKYSIDKSNGSIFLLKSQVNKLAESTFFKNNAENLLYRKYTKDTISYNTRIKDSEGIDKLKMPTEFSVQVLFYPQKQLFPFATVLGNATENSGFMIANNLGTDSYYFGINGKSYLLPLLSNKWVYLVMNVYSNRVEIFQNGALLNTLPLEGGYKNSEQKLYIANLGFMRNYFGEISEIAINKQNVQLADIKKVWETINEKINK